MPDSVRIFVLPPDMASLRARLEGRDTEAREQLAKRLAEAIETCDLKHPSA